MAALDAEFHLFPELPYEVRAAIWELCLPHRVEELECPHRYIRWPYIGCTLFSAHMANRRPPAISRVCHEARKIALQTGEAYARYVTSLAERFPVAPDRMERYNSHKWYMPVDATRYQPHYTLGPGDGARGGVDNALWTLPGRSSLHLNHTEDYQYDTEITWELEEPVACLHWYAQHLRATSVSIMADLILPFYENSLRRGPVVDVPMIRALRRALSYAAVVLHVPIHLTSATVARQSGLFGLLGDAPLQLVNPATDWARVEQFKALWRAHGPYGHASDRDAIRDFTVTLASQQGFAARCRLWLDDVEKVWVNRLHDADGREGLAKDEVNEADDMPKPDEDSVWTGSNDWDPWVRDIDWERSNIAAPTQYMVDLATRSLNKSNPWVQAQLAQMPQFVPHVMFRYCDAKCYLSKEERPARPIKG
ncbi:hypothetical protein SPBR_07354 [Sporothrix brasiliensis 5110]|uniref:2EXR domain-containing protein n=1 Tax=Sporothrix brasiliensis 5110 TaxID=1398154 RepID=A0A0C2FEB9_9PEZI|nr:uncharacterized protein SPBR_07354 [Sporothrix brasiliensis 5110]KIH89498.1 hypothetical protein SPBR_07354 [Sporothrix brasiliensis 5110]